MAWNDLTMRERNAYILTAILNGIYDRLQIIDAYNKFDDGGFSDGTGTEENPILLNNIDVYPDYKLELLTYYPVTSYLYPYTGHSALELLKQIKNEDGTHTGNYTTIGIVNKESCDSNYNLLTNNCSDATLAALEQVYGILDNPFLFTTPGDARDYFIEHGNARLESNKNPFREGTKAYKNYNKRLKGKNVHYQFLSEDLAKNLYLYLESQNGLRTGSYTTNNKFGDGGPKEDISWDETPEGIAANAAIGLVPVVGTANELRQFIMRPSWELAGWTALSALGDAATVLTFGMGEGVNAAISSAKATRSMSKAFEAYNTARKAQKLARPADKAVEAYEADVKLAAKPKARVKLGLNRRVTAVKNAKRQNAINRFTNLNYYKNSKRVDKAERLMNEFFNYGSLGLLSAVEYFPKYSDLN